MHRFACLFAIAACRGEPPATPVPPANHPAPPAVFPLWTAALKVEPFAIVGDSVVAWDRERDGVVDLDGTSGRELRFRAIGALRINGVPSWWQPIPGGYLAELEDLTQIREHAGALSVTWTSEGQWWGSWVIAGDTVIGARIHEPMVVVALGLLDGKPRWQVPIPTGAQDVKLAGDDHTIVIARQRYLKMPPGDHDIHRVLGAVDAATGAQRWSIELPYEPGELALGAGGIALATDAPKLVLYDAATGHATSLPLADRYPRLLVDAGVAYVADRDDSTIAAYQVRDGKLLWRMHHAVGNGAQPVVRDRLFVIGTSDGTVLALDRTTGAVQWEIGTGGERDKLFVGDHAVVAVSGSRAVGFTRPTTPPEPELATIHGRVRSVACGKVPGTTIRVGDQRVAVADDGRFTAQVRAVGVVRVAGMGSFSDDDAHQSSVAVRLTGAGDYTIPDLELGFCDRE